MDELTNIVEVRFDNLRFGRWQKVSIQHSVDDLCAAVNLSLTAPGTGGNLGFNENTVADVLINDVAVTTVRADSVRRHVTTNNHTIALQARSLGRELVDCQYSKTMSGIKLGEIVKQLCDTFKVPVKIAADTAVMPHFAMQCEQPANALLNAVRAANLLLYAEPNGGLILTEPDNSAPVATLVSGQLIKSYTINDEYKLRFSEYFIKSFDYNNNASRKGNVKDAGFKFFRPMHIVADRHGQGLGGLQRRAELERNRRIARAHSIDLEVFGWGYVTAAGKFEPWRINTQIRVSIPEENIDGVFLIGDCEYEQDDQTGTVSRLTVMHRNAFVGDSRVSKKHSAAHTRKKAKAKP